jgi:hypothetical protein
LLTAFPSRHFWLVLGGLAVLVLGAFAAYLVSIDRTPSRCAMLYAETVDEQYRNASWWTCYWAERQNRAKNNVSIFKIAAANIAEQVERARVARVKTEQEARLIEELRGPVCDVLDKRGRAPASRAGPIGMPVIDDGLLEVDLVGLSGHESIFAIDAVCRHCADNMATYYDATGARFCNVGGIAGFMCNEAKAFPHTGSLHREGTRAALMTELGCQ